MCNCRQCNMSEEENTRYATIYSMMESCKMTYTQASEIYPLVDEVASVAASKIGSLREVIANVIAANISLLPQDSEMCTKVIIYLTDVYLYNREQYNKEHNKCTHRHPDGSFAIEMQTRTRTGEEAYCTLCKKTGTRDELWQEAKCDHKHPDGTSAAEYCSTYEMRGWDMYCTICNKHGTREELEKGV